jgi:hypothetical protein
MSKGFFLHAALMLLSACLLGNPALAKEGTWGNMQTHFSLMGLSVENVMADFNAQRELSDASVDGNSGLSFGFRTGAAYDAGSGISFIPYIHGGYNFDPLSREAQLVQETGGMSEDRLFLGGGVAMQIGPGFIGRLQFDSEVKPDDQVYRAVLKVGYMW